MTTNNTDTEEEHRPLLTGRFEFPLARTTLEPTLRRARTNEILLFGVNVLWFVFEMSGNGSLWLFPVVGFFFTFSRLLKAVRRLRSLRDGLIWVDDTHFYLPMVATDQPSIVIPLSELCLVEHDWGVEDESGGIRIGTPDLRVSVPASVLEDAGSIHALSSLLINRVCQDPDGRGRLVAGQAIEVEQRARYGRRPILTMVLLATVTLVQLVEILTGAIGGSVLGGDPFELMRMGANVPTLVLGGEWDRLITATFMHGGWLHLMMNGIALLALGAIIENTMGIGRFTVVYGIAAIGASYASTLWSGALMSVGASGAIFGLLGALAVLQLLHRDVMPPRLRQSRRWWIIIILLNGALPLLIPQIDFVAHGAGFVLGAAATWGVAPRGSLADRTRRAPLWIMALAFGLGGLAVASVSIRAVEYQSVQDVGPRFMAHVPIEEPRLRGELNNVAWVLGTTDQVSNDRLFAARGMMERIVALEQSPTYQDTLATLWFRTGQAAKAIELERAVLVERDENFMASQVLRFMVGALDRLKTLGEVTRVAAETLRVRLPEDPDGRETAFWGVFVGERPYGLLRVTGAGPKNDEFVVKGDPIHRKDSAFIYLGRYKTIKGEGSPSARFWSYDRKVDALPPVFRRPRP